MTASRIVTDSGAFSVSRSQASRGSAPSDPQLATTAPPVSDRTLLNFTLPPGPSPPPSGSPLTAEAVENRSQRGSLSPVTMAYLEAHVAHTPRSSPAMGTFSSIFGGSQSLPRAEVSPTIVPAVVVGSSRSPSLERADSQADRTLPPATASTRPASLPSSDQVLPPHRVKGAEDCLKCRSSFGPFNRRHHVIPTYVS